MLLMRDDCVWNGLFYHSNLFIPFKIEYEGDLTERIRKGDSLILYGLFVRWCVSTSKLQEPNNKS